MNNEKKVNTNKQYFNFLDTIYKKPKKTLIAVSGGPDSMYVSHILQSYRSHKNWDPKYIYYIYCDHNIRKNNNDIETIQRLIGKEALYIATKDSKKKDEATLRKRRYEEINKYAKEKNIAILITGHNLSDRIESTFLHLLRGCSIDGFLNMKKIEKNSNMFYGTIIRPILEDTKEKIAHLCNIHNIPYVTDPTNNDVKFSKRNYIRKHIINPLRELSHKHTNIWNSFEESMQKIYEWGEENNRKKKNKLIPIPRYKIWNSKRAYRRDIKQHKITTQQLKRLIDTLHIGSNNTQKTLKELKNFLGEKNKGYKYINGIYRFISHGKIYIINAEKNFRTHKIKNKTKKLQDLFEEDYTIKNVTKERRRANEDEKIKGKSIRKRCINKKIPIFWRQNIIMIRKNGGKEMPHIIKGMI